MSPLRSVANKLGVGGVATLAVGAVLVAGVTAVGAANGADDRPAASPVTVAVPGNDDGTADQGSGEAPGSTSTTVTSTTAVPATTAPPAATRSIPVPGVGEVVITEGAALGLVAATPAAGFTVRTEASAREIHVRFFDANGGRIDVQVEIEGGAPRVRIRDRRAEGASNGNSSGGGRDDSPTVTTVPAGAPSTTIDDHGGRTDRDDRVEAGDDRDDRSGGDDSSGHGGGDDRGGDNSGHGSDD